MAEDLSRHGYYRCTGGAAEHWGGGDIGADRTAPCLASFADGEGGSVLCGGTCGPLIYTSGEYLAFTGSDEEFDELIESRILAWA